MLRAILLFLLIGSFFSHCMSDKVCSDQDRSCNLAANLLSSFSSVPDGIYLYPTSVTYTGNFAENSQILITEASIICDQELAPYSTFITSCQKSTPFLSTDTVALNALGSFLSDFPLTGKPIRGLNTAIISDSYATLFTEDLKSSLAAAGIGTDPFWSFGNASGGYDGTVNGTCEGGVNLTVNGIVGSTTATGVESWFNSTSIPCSTPTRLLCLCYSP